MTAVPKAWLALAVLFAGALAALPPAQAANSAELPSPCGPTASCEGPSCAPARVSTSDLLAYLGPHATLTVDSSCNLTVEERGLHCAIGDADFGHTIGPVQVGADLCMPDLPACRPTALHSDDLVALIPKEVALALWAEARLDRDCTVEAEERGVQCPAAWEPYEGRHQAGPVEVVADSCTPMTACTCDPVDAASMAVPRSALLGTLDP